MPPLKTALSDYLEMLTGVRPELTPRANATLPLFLRSRYELVTAQLFGRKYILALECSEAEPETSGDYERQSELLSGKLGERVVLVISRLPSHARNRLVRRGIPFIVPGNQLFLPPLAADLREYFPAPKKRAVSRLTPAAQCVLLYHLQRAPLDGMPLREVAEKVGYVPMMLSKVKAELIATGLAEVERKGHALALRFRAQGRELWQLAEPMLSSPVRKSHWVRGTPESIAGSVPAGLTVLAKHTLITDDRLPTRAMAADAFRAALDARHFTVCPGPEDADLRLETWSYAPIITKDGREADPLSVWLSLRDTADERVRHELQEFLHKTLSW